MMNPLVTVIIPAFNQASYIEQSARSILDQSFGDLELIIVDDGSADETAQIAGRLADARLQVVRQENAGPSAAINNGLRRARGKFIALLGGDDLAEHDRIARQVEVLAGTEHSAVFCRPSLIDETGCPLAEDEHTRVFNNLPEADTAAAHVNSLFYSGNYLCAPSACLKRDAVERVGLFHEGLIQLQDLDYWVRMFGLGLTCSVYGRKLVRYRRHTANLSSSRRLHADRRERFFIWRNFFTFIKPAIARTAFSDVLDPGPRSDAELSGDELGMVYLTHSDKDIREMGYEHLIRERRTGECSGRRWLSFPDYFHVLNEPDLPKRTG